MIRIGTCSWKYDSWKGLVYSENVGKDYLPEYSNHFNTVEIDQWFWSLFADDKVVLPQSHIVKSYFDFLNHNNLSPVLLQGYYMPPIFDTYLKYNSQIENGSL